MKRGRFFMIEKISCIILAGGLGTRMADYTKNIPKPMIPVNGAPFIDHQLKLLQQNGVTDVILSLGYKGDVMRGYVGDGGKWNLNIQYTDEGTELRGTGGAIRLIAEKGLLPEKFFLLYGDSYLPVEYQKIWSAFDQMKAPALLTVFKNSDNWDASNVIFKNGKLELYDKFAQDKKEMDYIDFGLAIFTKKIIQDYFFTKEKFDLAEIYNLLSKKSLLAGYEVMNRFYEIGSSAGLQELCDKLK